MNQFVIYFDVAALMILVVVLSLYRHQRLVKNYIHYTYIAFWVSAFTAPLADILAVCSIDYNNSILFEVTNTLYYLGIQWSGFFFYLFTLAPLSRKDKTNGLQKAILSIPILATSALILLNPFFHTINLYDFETHIYTTYFGLTICYINVAFYYIRSISFVVRRKDVYNVHIRGAILNTFVLITISVIVQALMPKYQLHSFFISLALLQMLVVTLHEGTTKNPETGMISRNAFYDRVNNLIYNNVAFSAVTFRLADFEVILATYGLEALNELEKQICNEVLGMIPKDSGYKLNDDIYSFIFEEQSIENREYMIKELDALLSRKWTVHGIDISFSHFVVGFCYPNHFKSMDELVGLMVYLSKTRRMRYGIMPVEEFAIRDLHREQDIEHVLVDALKKRDFEVYYHPILNTKTNAFTSAEALIRLYKSSMGPIGPSEFIPIAEKTGLIIQIGEYVIEEVCKFISTHNLQEMGVKYIEVNLSAIQCLQRNFFSVLMGYINKYNVKPESICFEITETASNCAPEIFTENLMLLHKQGFKLAIDDFGTGYGNLQRLISMDFDIVKFDNETTRQICVDEKIKPIFKKMVTMIHSMNASVVAEGVELFDEVEYLKSIKTDYLQGYYYSIPLSSDEYLNFLENHKENI